MRAAPALPLLCALLLRAAFCAGPEREGAWSALPGTDAELRAERSLSSGAVALSGLGAWRGTVAEARGGAGWTRLPGRGGWTELRVDLAAAARPGGLGAIAGVRAVDRRAGEGFAETEFLPGAGLLLSAAPAGGGAGREFAATFLVDAERRILPRLSLLVRREEWSTLLELRTSAREPPTVFVSETLRARGALSLRLDAEGPPARLGLSIAVGLGRAGALLLAAAGGSGDDGACGLGWRARP